MKSASIAAVMFDLDGTLADTIYDLGGAVNSILKLHGFPEHSPSDYKRMVGNGFTMLIERALSPSALKNTVLVSTVSREAASAYAETALATTKPFPGIPELLSDLRARNIVLAVLSNKPDTLTKIMVGALFPDISFLEVLGESPDSPRKPDPTNALAISARSGIPAKDWAFVGDSGVDMETGRSSGMLPCGAAWGYRSVSELLDHGAEVLLEKPADLLLSL
jgi:phosphoglycolate phosphatase